MSVTEPDLQDPALVAEVDLARAAAQEEAGDEEVGAHVGTHIEGDAAVTHLFQAAKPGYQGWRWAATLSSAGAGAEVTVSEVVLVPGPDALVAPDWVPWEHRVQAGDLGVGDLLPTAPDDPRLVPGYLESDDSAVEEVAVDVGLGRTRVMARPARLDAASRWQQSEFGPRSDMARSAPAHCGTCGFYLPLAGSLRAAFGTCGNEISPADGHVVHTEYGCGAHSEAEVEQVSPVLVANLIYDDARLDLEPLAEVEVPEAPTDAEAEAPAASATEAAEAPTEVPADAELAGGPAEAPADAKAPEAPADAEADAPAANATEAAEVPAADLADERGDVQVPTASAPDAPADALVTKADETAGQPTAELATSATESEPGEAPAAEIAEEIHGDAVAPAIETAEEPATELAEAATAVPADTEIPAAQPPGEQQVAESPAPALAEAASPGTAAEQEPTAADEDETPQTRPADPTAPTSWPQGAAAEQGIVESRLGQPTSQAGAPEPPAAGPPAAEQAGAEQETAEQSQATEPGQPESTQDRAAEPRTAGAEPPATGQAATEHAAAEQAATGPRQATAHDRAAQLPTTGAGRAAGHDQATAAEPGQPESTRDGVAEPGAAGAGPADG